jgi:hypothetical protein
MFSLTEADLGRRILGCADGPASFNAQLSARGGEVVSCDPLYDYSVQQIQSRIDATYQMVMRQTAENRHLFVWDEIGGPEELGRRRMEAMSLFLADYEAGKREGRYQAGELPSLYLDADSCDLALCSHFLFLYSDTLSLDFHKKAVEEMCRVAKELRIFPLLTYHGEPSPFAAPIVDFLRVRGYQVTIETVGYEFQRGGNKMLRVTR